MDGYIAKPLDQAELRETIRSVLARDRSEGSDGIVDWAHAHRRVPGGKSGVRRLAALMEKEGPRLLQEIRRGAATGDAERVRLGAHTLKGSASHFGATSVMEAAERAEHAARDSNLEAVNALLPELGERVEEFSAALARGEAPPRT